MTRAPTGAGKLWAPGDVIADRFTLEELAGVGGMGTVYRAHDAAVGRKVAVKLIAGGDDRSSRFQREAEVLASLHHPGIVRYVAHGTAPFGLYLAMEWLEGIDLAQRMANDPPSIQESVRLGRRVAEALAHAHLSGVVHRDIKPSNLFLEYANLDRVKIVDFGVARLTRAFKTATQAGVVMGTPEYMAPEQARGAQDVDARVDVFALGCVLYECVTGRPAFMGEHVMAVLAKILFEELPPMCQAHAAVPQALDELVRRMLAKDRGERPSNAAEVVQALSALGDVAETGPAPDWSGAPEAPASLTRGERRLVAVVAAWTKEAQALTEAGRAERDTLDRADIGGELSALQGLTRPFGAQVELLANGAVVATLAQSGAATDLAAAAARCALAIRGRLPDAAMAIATGRAEVSERLPVGEVIDRVAALVESSRESIVSNPRPIRIDDTSVGLLDSRFDIGGDLAGLYLLRARDEEEAIRTLLGKPSPFMGRELELGLLAGVLDQCIDESTPHAVILTAQPGAGKSRLRAELVRRLEAREDRVEVWIGRGDPMRAGSPLSMLGQVVRDAAQLRDGEPVVVRRQKLRARIARHVAPAHVGRLAAFLGELLGIPGDEESIELREARADAMLMSDQLRRAFEDLVAAECEAQPLLLVLDDLQWGDGPTVDWIDALLRNLSRAPLMVFALGRPEITDLFPRIWAERSVTTIQLSALTRKPAEKLVRQMLGERASDELVARMVERAAGNPFYLEELIRSVASGREDLPVTVLAMVQSRLESLEASDRRLLRAASVFGRSFWRGGVQALSGEGGDIEGALLELTGREVIEPREGGRFADEEYTFRHSLVREAAYAMLTDTDRALGHRLAGEWLERMGERDPIVLAEHFERGGERSRAGRWYGKAAESAMEANDLPAAVARAEQSIACGAAGEEAGALRLLQAEAHRWRGENADAERRAAEAVELLPPSSARWFAALGELAVAAGRLGRTDRIVAHAEELASRPLVEATVVQHAIAAICASVSLLQGGRYELANRLFDRLDGLSPETVEAYPTLAGRLGQARALRARLEGDLAAHLEHNREATRAYRRAGDLRNACRQLISVGYANLQLGAYAAAEIALREALSSGERLGLTLVIAGAQHNLGPALAGLGAYPAARELEAAAVVSFRAQGNRYLEGGSLIYAASIAERADDLAVAERSAREAVELLRIAPPAQAYAFAVLTKVLLRRGANAEALESAVCAKQILDRLGSLEEGDSMVRLSHAEALRASGSHAEAREAIVAARDRLLTRASKISDAQLRASFLEAVPENARTLALAARW